MAASASGPLGVLLMIAPLAAIPVLAIVGVPQFAPVSASPADEDDFDDLGDASDPPSSPEAEAPRQPRSGSGLFAQAPKGPATPGESAELGEPAGLGKPPGGEPEPRPMAGRRSEERTPARELPPPEALDEWEVRPDLRGTEGSGRSRLPRPGSNAASEPPGASSAPADEDLVASDAFTPDLLTPDRSRPDRKSSGSNSRGTPTRPQGNDTQPGTPRSTGGPAAEALNQLMAEQSGWQAAARRLKELGIRKYRLESQIEEQQFLFVCSFASPGNPRVVRRFEATADNPLEAVQAVLEQIDEWRGRDGQTEEAPLTLDDE